MQTMAIFYIHRVGFGHGPPGKLLIYERAVHPVRLFKTSWDR